MRGRRDVVHAVRLEVAKEKPVHKMGDTGGGRRSSKSKSLTYIGRAGLARRVRGKKEGQRPRLDQKKKKKLIIL